MAPLAIITSSAIGAVSGFLLWLMASVGAGTAFAIYLGFSLGLPLLFLIAASLVGRSRAPSAPSHAEDTKALAA